MSVQTPLKPVGPAQPRSVRGIVRTGEVEVPGLFTDARPSRTDFRHGVGVVVAGAARVGGAVSRAAWRRRVALLLFLLPFACYVTLGALLAFRYDSFNGDAQARVANAYYVMFSRDPHMGAIGFVWNPLPSISTMPVLLFKGIWAPLATRAFAGNIVSAAFMAGCVVLIHTILREFRVRRSARIGLTLLFGLQPMIVYYGANGMSEAIFLFFLIATVRWMARWLVGNNTWDLMLGGTALAFAYLARNEAVMPALLAAGVVALVTALRAGGDIRFRARAAAVSGFVFAAPAAFAFVMWALISWIIVGHPFEQFSSQYGTAAQLQAVGKGIEESRGAYSRPAYEFLQLGGLAPTLPLAALLAAFHAFRRKDLRALAPAAVLGGVVAFAVLAFLMGQTAGWLRYDITVVPLLFLLIGSALARSADVAGRWKWLRGGLALLVAASIAVPSMVSSVFTMADPHLGREERLLLGYVVDPHPNADEYSQRRRFASSEQVARYLDAKHLRRGSVIVDTFTICVPFVVLRSENPDQFVITNDRDFKPVLADPVTFGAQYLLVPELGGTGNLDEINRTYPNLYESGAGIAKLDHEFNGKGCPALRLYELNHQPS